MKLLFLVLLLLLNDKEGVHATQGKQTYSVDVPSFVLVVVNGRTCSASYTRSCCIKKLKLNERNVVIDSFKRLVDR